MSGIIDWSKAPEWADYWLQKSGLEYDEEIFRWGRHETNTGKIFNEGGRFSHAIDLTEWKVIATRPQQKRKTIEEDDDFVGDVMSKALEDGCKRKTVHDAVKAFPDGWPEILQLPDIEGWWFHGDGTLVWSHQEEDLCKHQVVCTREQFEQKYAERNKQSEWTHTRHGIPCKIISGEKDKLGCVAILNIDGVYDCVAERILKPIKPTITQFEADKLKATIKEAQDKLDNSEVAG